MREQWKGKKLAGATEWKCNDQLNSFRLLQASMLWLLLSLGRDVPKGRLNAFVWVYWLIRILMRLRELLFVFSLDCLCLFVPIVSVLCPVIIEAGDQTHDWAQELHGFPEVTEKRIRIQPKMEQRRKMNHCTALCKFEKSRVETWRRWGTGHHQQNKIIFLN